MFVLVPRLVKRRVPEFVPMDATAVYLDGNRLSGDALISDEFIGRKHLTELYLNSSGLATTSIFFCFLFVNNH